MPLLGSAAMLLSFDVVPDAVEEHDRWHTQEHLPERLSIPGFLRGTRWVAAEGGPRYMVLYEVESLRTLASDAYLASLNAPTPWTRRMMPSYRGMRRGLCSILGSFGFGQGGAAALIRFAADEAARADVQRWLLEEVLPAVPTMSGLGSAHLLQGDLAAEMTNEQRIRGGDGDVDSAIIVTGYELCAVSDYAEGLRGKAPLCNHVPRQATYIASYSLARAEVEGWSSRLGCTFTS